MEAAGPRRGLLPSGRQGTMVAWIETGVWSERSKHTELSNRYVVPLKLGSHCLRKSNVPVTGSGWGVFRLNAGCKGTRGIQDALRKEDRVNRFCKKKIKSRLWVILSLRYIYLGSEGLLCSFPLNPGPTHLLRKPPV